MAKQTLMRRPRKARTWLRTREVERLRVHSLQLDIQALHSEIRALTTTRMLLHERLRSHDRHNHRNHYDHQVDQVNTSTRSRFPRDIPTPSCCGGCGVSHVMTQKIRISALLNPLP